MRVLCVTAALVCGGAFAQPVDAPTRVVGMSKEDVAKTLYSVGVSMGRSLDTFALAPEELEALVRGIRDAQTGQVKQEDFETYQPRIRELEFQRREKRIAAEKERGRVFAAAAAKEEGAEVSSTGLVYRETSPGVGPSPTLVDTVKVHYRGRLIDGREFDSSFRRGEPAQFSLSQVVACWSEALQKMKAGGRARLVCPSAIAYGDRGQGTTIPPGATLVFDVELLDVVKRGSTTVK